MKEVVERRDYDAAEKQLESYPDVFADIVNALVYEGKRVLKTENLRQAAQETLYKGTSGKLRRQFEDVAKYDADGKSAKVHCLLANQSDVNNRMLLRKRGYEGGVYQEQYEDKVHYICPVIELILYWGEPLWKGTRTIHGFFAGSGLEPEAWDYIDNGRLHVFEMRRLPGHIRERFTGDMRIVLEFLVDEKSLTRLEQEVVHPIALLDFLGELSGDNRFEELARQLYEQQREKTREGGKWKMCELVTELIEQGRMEGIRQGIQATIAICKKFKVVFEDAAEQIKEQFHLSDEETQQNMRQYW